MTIQPIGSASVALYITPADLKEHGLTPAQLTLEQAMTLARTAFQDAGIPLSGALEIEAFPDEIGVLVFARVQAPARLWITFSDFEALLTALRALPSPVEDAALFWLEDRYWISLSPGEDAAQALLSEYGDTQTPSPQQELRIEEHALPILPDHAAERLLRYFPV